MPSLVTTNFRYRPIREIGSGAFGTVYLVADPQLGGQFAAKEIPIDSFDDKGFDSLFSEAQSMHASNCSNVVQIRSAGKNKKHVSILMPYYAKGSLEDRIARNPLSLTETIRIGDQILAGLGQIHRAKVVHFDLKPSNVLFDDHDRAMVADFGQARRMKIGGIAEAPEMYRWARPPEVYDTGEGSVAADIYQAGMTLYRAVNGEPFYKQQATKYLIDRAALVAAIQHGKFPNRSAWRPHVPDRLRRTIRKALKVDPSQRYRTADEFQDALGRVSVPIDWVLTEQPNHDLRWQAARPKQTGLAVDLKNGKDCYAVEVHTIRNGRPPRKKNPDGFWRKCTTEADANRHLEHVFTELA